MVDRSFGQSVQSDDATPGLIAFLRSQRVLLMLDTCEHPVETVAPLAAITRSG
jgi:predicted ATPase